MRRLLACALLCLLSSRCGHLADILYDRPPPVRQAEAPPPAKPDPPKTTIFLPGFSVVTARAGDTFASLAGEHLGDATLDWRLERFNGGLAPRPGKALLVPHEPFDRGGSREGRYQAVPVISYHQFSKTRSDTMTVTAKQFTAQMKHLRREGFTTVTLDEVFDFLDFQADLPEKAVVITFDDGWRSVYDIAFPIIRRFGFKATLFVTTGMVSGSDSTLSWEQIAEMSAAGFSVQSHSVDHRDLTIKRPDETLADYLKDVAREMTDSAKIIEEKTGRPVRYFAYPYGNLNPLVVTLLRKSGYRGGLTVARGSNPFYVNNYRVGRSMIYGDFDMKIFRRNLATFVAEPAP